MATNQFKVFLSYSRADYRIVQGVYNKLVQLGIEVFLDVKIMKPGDPWKEKIERAIKETHCVLIFYSNNAIHKEGYFHVEEELAKQIALTKPFEINFIIPIILDALKSEIPFENINYCDWNDKDHWSNLLSALKVMASKKGCSFNSFDSSKIDRDDEDSVHSNINQGNTNCLQELFFGIMACENIIFNQKELYDDVKASYRFMPNPNVTISESVRKLLQICQRNDRLDLLIKAIYKYELLDNGSISTNYNDLLKIWENCQKELN